ncbi:MAG: hypothetical protein L6V85_04820 [Clostridiales bacterium]|nr:MAG: hypothetical protein L6V85_04820 [Clostridiales bacterium]
MNPSAINRNPTSCLATKPWQRNGNSAKKVGSDLLSIVDCGADFGSGYVPLRRRRHKNVKKTYLIKKTVSLREGFIPQRLPPRLTKNLRATPAQWIASSSLS